MSSSLFYDCYASYETYPHTEYVEGDKKFGEIGIGDTLYRLDTHDTLIELEVTNPFHIAKGNCYITIKGKGMNINFGTQYCANVLEARNKSIVFYNNGIIGTNKESVIKRQCTFLEKEMEKCYNGITEMKKKYEILEKRLSNIITNKKTI